MDLGTKEGFRCAATGLALLAGLLAGACSKPERPPNVVLISIDTLRADHLGCYGYGRATSPRLDRLAAEGVVFEDAWSTTSWTLPAHLSMLTGLPISAHCGCGENLTEPEAHADHGLRGTMVSEELALAGFDTAGFYTFRYLDPEFGFGDGFETWQLVPRSLRSEPELFAKYKAMKDSGDGEGVRAMMLAHPDLFETDRVWAPETVDRALAWVDGKRTGEPDPFFLFLHLFDVHDPYLPPPPHDRQFDPDYDGPIDGRHVSTPDSPVRIDMKPRDLEHLIALYDGEIAAVDAQIGRLLDGLAQRGLAEDTLVIVTSDHGEEFFEHGRKLHRHGLHRETTQVPLIVRWPRGIEAGRRVRAPVSLIDLVPTLRAACGLEADPELPGLDLLPAARGNPLEVERDVVSELLMRDEQSARWVLSLVDARHHTLIDGAGTPEARATRYDRVRDPLEREAPETIAWDSLEGARLSARVDALRREYLELRRKMAVQPLDARPISAEAEERIRALGYSGSVLSPVYAGEREMPLCFEGCVWKP